jgi:hypothetical protein
MKLLLDESVPRGLRSHLPGHVVSTVRDEGWLSRENGRLLEIGSRDFDVFITADQNLEHQQNLARFEIGILVLVARKNRLVDYLPLVPKILEALQAIQPGELRHIAVG